MTKIKRTSNKKTKSLGTLCRAALLLDYPPLADGPVLGLPGVEVEQGGEGLAQDGEGDPEDAVADQLAGGALYLLQRLRQDDERELQEHAECRDACGFVTHCQLYCRDVAGRTSWEENKTERGGGG